MMEKSSISFSIFDLTLLFSFFGLDVSINLSSWFKEDEEDESISNDLVPFSGTAVNGGNLMRSKGSFPQELEHLSDDYSFFMRNALARPPSFTFRNLMNRTTITPARDVVAMVVNAPVMTLHPHFGGNILNRTDPLNVDFNLFDSLQPSRMTEEAIRNLRIESSGDLSSWRNFGEDNLSEQISDLNINSENDATLPIPDIQMEINEPAVASIDSFLTPFDDLTECAAETTSQEEGCSSAPSFHSPILNRRELFPMLDSTLDGTEDDRPITSVEKLFPHNLDHTYCSSITDSKMRPSFTYSVRAREKVTTRVISVPAKKTTNDTRPKDEGIDGAEVGGACRTDMVASRNSVRRETIGSDSGVEEDIEILTAPSIGLQTILLDSCRDNNFLHNVSPPELLCAKQ